MAAIGMTRDKNNGTNTPKYTKCQSLK